MNLASSLRAALVGRGWQPARAQIPALFELLSDGDRDDAELAERALARLGEDIVAEIVTRITAAPSARLVALAGRLAGEREAARPKLLPILVAVLGGGARKADQHAMRSAANALGRLPDAAALAEPALLAGLAKAEPATRRAIVAALGKIGGDAALAALDGLDVTSDAELARIAGEARLKLRRTLVRPQTSGIRGDARPARPTPVVLHCRRGLAPLVAAEIRGAGIESPETVRATLDGPLSSLFTSRVALRFGFPLPRKIVDAGLGPVGDAVVGALASPECRAIVEALSTVPARYRLEWADAGHRRGLTFRVAAALAERAPFLANDPTASDWEAVITESSRPSPSPDGARKGERENKISVELWPRGLDDPRFAWRVAQVPAGSHPTVAAALAQVGGAHKDDIVWDPFVGAATELVERAKRGGFSRLFGSDLDPQALDAARQNLAAAGLPATLFAGDAVSAAPPIAPTLIITNPPLGRRVLDRRRTGDLYEGFLRNAAASLKPGGRIAWMTPRPTETDDYAAAAGLAVDERLRVDMGGFTVELQRLVHAAAPAPSRRKTAPGR
jgi:hypothetical protein